MIFFHVLIQLTYLHAWNFTCLDWDEVQDLGFWLMKYRVRDIVVYHEFLTWLFLLGGSNHKWVYLSILTIGWMHPYLRYHFIYTLLWMVVPMPHAHVSMISVVLYLQVFQHRCFVQTCSHKAFHSSLSVGPHTWGASVTQHFVTVPAIPIPHIGGPFLWCI